MTPVEIVRGKKLDGSQRPMYFILKNGKKTRIGERKAQTMIGRGAVEVAEFKKAQA